MPGLYSLIKPNGLKALGSAGKKTGFFIGNNGISIVLSTAFSLF